MALTDDDWQRMRLVSAVSLVTACLLTPEIVHEDEALRLAHQALDEAFRAATDAVARHSAPP